MRIGIFSESFEPVQNGVSTSVRTLIDELRAHHHRVVVVAPYYPDYVDDSPFILRVPSVRTPFNPNYPLSYPWFPNLRRNLTRIAPDILHSHTPFFLGLLASRIAKQDNIPLVSTYHTLYNHYGHYLVFLPPQAVEGLLEWWMPEYYNRCNHVIVPSKIAEQSLRQYKVETPVTVIPTAVPLPHEEDVSDQSRRKARERFKIPIDGKLLLYVGRIAQEKNIELAMESFQTVVQKHKDAYLLIIGGGPHYEACRKIVESFPDGDRIILAGPMIRAELDPFYAAADIFVFPSSTETQGLVIAEARAAGTPCVVVDEGGACETVVNEEDGIITKSDPEAFSKAILALLDDPSRMEGMRRKCLLNAQKYTPSSMGEKIIGIYEAVLEERNQRYPALQKKHPG
jgi:1,2-diacylglycerol 3-alpha-glucosyltransferase